MTNIAHALAQFDYAVRLKKDPKNKEKTYVIAYRNTQEILPDGRRRSRIAESFHIGPLQDDNSIKLGSAFLKRYPDFEGETVFYLANQLLTKSAYQKALKAQVDTPSAAKESASLPLEDASGAELDVSQAIVFDHYAKKNDLLSLLQAVWESDATKLYALLMYVCQRLGGLEHFDERREGYYIPLGQPLSAERLSEILSGVTDSALEEFWEGVMERYLQGGEHFYGYAFDTTDASTNTEHLAYAEWRGDEEGQSASRVSVTTMVDAKTGRLLYAKEGPGSLPDVAAFEGCYRDVFDEGLSSHRITQVLDCASDSVNGLKALLSDRTPLVMKANVATNKALREQIRSLHEEIVSALSVILDGSKVIYGLRGQAIPVGPKGANDVLYPCLYVDLFRQAYMMHELDSRIKKAISLRQQGQAVPVSLLTEVQPYIVEANGTWLVNHARVLEDRRYFGSFVLWTTSDADSVEATLAKYRSRNEIHAQLEWMKYALHCSNLPVSEGLYRGVLLLNLLAGSLRQQLSQDIKTNRYCQENNITSVDQVLSILSGLKIKYRSQRWRVIEPTAKHRRLLEALGIKPC